MDPAHSQVMNVWQEVVWAQSPAVFSQIHMLLSTFPPLACAGPEQLQLHSSEDTVCLVKKLKCVFCNFLFLFVHVALCQEEVLHVFKGCGEEQPCEGPGSQDVCLHVERLKHRSGAVWPTSACQRSASCSAAEMPWNWTLVGFLWTGTLKPQGSLTTCLHNLKYIF